jgi:hypothetical protein
LNEFVVIDLIILIEVSITKVFFDAIVQDEVGSLFIGEEQTEKTTKVITSPETSSRRKRSDLARTITPLSSLLRIEKSKTVFISFVGELALSQ